MFFGFFFSPCCKKGEGKRSQRRFEGEDGVGGRRGAGKMLRAPSAVPAGLKIWDLPALGGKFSWKTWLKNQEKIGF